MSLYIVAATVAAGVTRATSGALLDLNSKDLIQGLAFSDSIQKDEAAIIDELFHQIRKGELPSLKYPETHQELWDEQLAPGPAFTPQDDYPELFPDLTPQQSASFQPALALALGFLQLAVFPSRAPLKVKLNFVAECYEIMPTIHAHEYPIKDIFSDIFAFSVPNYQRPYRWGIEQTSELLSDLIGASEGFVPGVPTRTTITPYFLGSIVLIKGETAPEADIIDGQQRLTTLSLLLSALRVLLDSQEHRDTFRNRVFEKGSILAGTKDRCRLKLRERDHDFFEKNVLRNESLEGLAELLKTKLPDPQRRVASNCLYLVEKVKEMRSERRNALAAFLFQHTYLVVVSTPDMDSAFRIFSVLNDRGLDLTAADILKAEIIGKIPDAEQQSSVEAWEDAEEELGTDRFSELFSHIRMIHARSKLRKTVLEGIRESVPLLSEPKKFIRDELIPSSETYAAILKQAFDRADDASNKRINRLLGRLARLDDTDWVPPAILFLRRDEKSPAELEAFLQNLERLGSALWLLRRDVNERISRYARILEAIDKGEDLAVSSSPIQLADEEKRQVVDVLDGDIYNLTPKTKRTVVLLRLDEALSSGEASYELDRITVEHILPQTPDQNSEWYRWWPHADEREKNVHRIGNLALLNRRQNSAARNWELAKKKQNYQPLTRCRSTWRARAISD